MVPLSWFMMLSTAVFMIGMFGVLTRRNIIIMFLSIELILNAVNINLIAFSRYLEDMRGQILTLFIIAVAASEAAIGLALIIALFRNKPTTNVDEIDEMKG